MAAVTNLSGLTVLDDNINAEFISQEVHLATQTPYLYEAIVAGGGTKSLIGMATRTYAHPIWARMAVASAITESDEVGATALSSSEVTISTALKSAAAFITDQATGASNISVASLAINRTVDAVRRAINADTVALATSISSSAGSNATTNDVSNMNVALTAYRALVKSNLSGGALMVLHGDAKRDLQEDAVNTTNALYSSAVGENLFDATNQAAMGQVSRFGSFTIVDTDDMPAGDTTGWTNMIVDAGGAETAFALVVSKGVTVATEREERRFGSWVIASADYGVGIVDQNRCHAFITKT